MHNDNLWPGACEENPEYVRSRIPYSGCRVRCFGNGGVDLTLAAFRFSRRITRNLQAVEVKVDVYYTREFGAASALGVNSHPFLRILSSKF